ncbi:MAG: permease [Candidatus Accumulibacter sp.]|nr:permease [Accumulibacter sp.]MBO3708232.1 permease [Candidatus Accumulibacter conexus]
MPARSAARASFHRRADPATLIGRRSDLPQACVLSAIPSSTRGEAAIPAHRQPHQGNDLEPPDEEHPGHRNEPQRPARLLADRPDHGRCALAGCLAPAHRLCRRGNRRRQPLAGDPFRRSGTLLLIGRLKMEAHLENWVQEILARPAAAADGEQLSWLQRLQTGGARVREIVGKVWPYVVAGIGLGAAIHGYVPEDFMASFMGRDAWWAVPAAVLLGVPMYSNAAGIIPIVEALIGKGAAIGTVLAFMMAVIALSAPEMIILRQALRPKLIATFAGVVASGILLVGYVFNWVL